MPTPDPTTADPALIAEAETRGGLVRLAKEQTALRRVATLVAAGLAPEEVFAAVTEEVGLLLEADLAALSRLDGGESVTTVMIWTRSRGTNGVGRRWELGGENVATAVARSGRPARTPPYDVSAGPLGDFAPRGGPREGVGAPVIVLGVVWGVMAAFSAVDRPLPLKSEELIADFTGLLGMAIANAESRAELAASRARIVAATDDARRRIERDLHDGVQQRLVSLGLELRATQAGVPDDMAELSDGLGRLAQGLSDVQLELRELARGIHPAILAEGGLGPALKALARRSPIPVELDLRDHPRLPEQVEVAGYYVVSEALTNAAKHSHASEITVELSVDDETLHLRVRDDGAGGADPSGGSGLIGLRDRVEAAAGTIAIESAPGAGTTLRVKLPFSSP
jgi:signal transduction histidine kinase